MAPAARTAHHIAFGGEFDANKPVLLKGKLVKVEWVNPHSWLHIEAPKADGGLSGSGWMQKAAARIPCSAAAPRTASKLGPKLWWDGYRARDHSLLRAEWPGNITTAWMARSCSSGSSGHMALRTRTKRASSFRTLRRCRLVAAFIRVAYERGYGSCISDLI